MMPPLVGSPTLVAQCQYHTCFQTFQAPPLWAGRGRGRPGDGPRMFCPWGPKQRMPRRELKGKMKARYAVLAGGCAAHAPNRCGTSTRSMAVRIIGRHRAQSARKPSSGYCSAPPPLSSSQLPRASIWPDNVPEPSKITIHNKSIAQHKDA